MTVERNYDLMLLSLRQMAFDAGDRRSLVAIAAEFERNGMERLRKIIDISESLSHVRNET
jgi:hypothetical protein